MRAGPTGTGSTPCPGSGRDRKIGHPRFRSRKDHRQSIRLTRNGFALRRDRLYVAKVGDIEIRWSRPLPSVPSSVTVIREADGRYYASFVVEVAATPLPAVTADVGIDLGLTALAATSGGELIANPRHLQRRQRQLARAQRSLSPQAERFREPGEGQGPRGRAPPEGPRGPGRRPAQDSASAGPRQPSGLRRGSCGIRPGADQAGEVRARCRVGHAGPAAGGEGGAVRQVGNKGRTVVPVQPDLLACAG